MFFFFLRIGWSRWIVCQRFFYLVDRTLRFTYYLSMKDFKSDDEFIESLTAAQVRYLRKLIAEILASDAKTISQIQDLKRIFSESE
jgi:hypothetical protein